MNGFKSGFVSIVGRPNVGKSTLLNAILGEKITIVSDRAQTTRNSILGVLSDEKYQVVFTDTPGMHEAYNKLSEFMIESIEASLEAVDVVLAVVDSTSVWKKDRELIKKIDESGNKYFIVLNKVDLTETTEIKRILSDEYPDCAGIFEVSAKEGKGIKRLVDAVIDLMEEGPKYFPDDQLTDRTERFVIAEIIREKCLGLLKEEIPHGIGVLVEKFSERSDTLTDISAVIYCEKKSHKSIVIGKNGSMIKQIGILSRKEAEAFLNTSVNLQLWVKIHPDWRNDEKLMKQLGYGE